MHAFYAALPIRNMTTPSNRRPHDLYSGLPIPSANIGGHLWITQQAEKKL
jgi:hypothetical protein